jgi:hypothetical protein
LRDPGVVGVDAIAAAGEQQAAFDYHPSSHSCSIRLHRLCALMTGRTTGTSAPRRYRR